MASKKKEEVSSSPLLAAAVKKAPQDSGSLEAWPTLCSVLMPIWKDDTCLRQSGSLRIRLVGGYYVVTVSCPTEGLETSVMVESLVDLFGTLEAKLRDPGCPWTPDWESQKRTRQVKIERLK